MTEETSTQKAEKTAKKSEDAAFVTWQQISTFSGTYGAVALSWTGLKELFGSDSWAGETWVAYLLGLMILLGVAVFSYKEEISQNIKKLKFIGQQIVLTVPNSFVVFLAINNVDTSTVTSAVIG
jgi:hypothetical protein